MVICNLYKKDTGRWYGQFSFMLEGSSLPDDEDIIREGKKHYSFPEDYFILVQYGNFSKLITHKI